MLLDYYMPGGMTGEETVKEIRRFDDLVRIIIQTGCAGEFPPRELLKRLDISGYYNKADGPEHLLLWVDVGLKSAAAAEALNGGRQGLRFILDATPELHKVQPLEDLLQAILQKTSALLGIIRGQDDPEGFLALVEEGSALTIRATTSGFLDSPHSIDLNSFASATSDFPDIRDMLLKKQVLVSESASVVPLVAGDQILGIVYLKQPVFEADDAELLQIFANQAGAALQNSRLYEMATLDPLTGVYVRRFFSQCFLRELRTAFRSHSTLTLLMIDMDGLKKINDTAGHIAGDQALAICGKVVRQATRNTDFVGRYGGDEFSVILPQTDRLGTEVVCARIFSSLMGKSIKSPAECIPIRVSIGAVDIPKAVFAKEDRPRSIGEDYFEKMARELTGDADEKLYQAKREGGSRLCFHDSEAWAEFE